MPETGSRLVARLIRKLSRPNAGQFASRDHSPDDRHGELVTDS
jgi:hypothetical protein